MGKCDIYGPDPAIADKQAATIAKTALGSVKVSGTTDVEAKSTGPDTSRNGLERLK